LNLDETVLCDININAEELEKRRKELKVWRERICI